MWCLIASIPDLCPLSYLFKLSDYVVASSAVHLKGVFLLMFTHCLLLLSLCLAFYVGSYFLIVFISVFYSLTFILLRKREPVALV